jgi:acyl-CoA synthetase (AMP-forming)/AMP-acid ligase II
MCAQYDEEVAEADWPVEPLAAFPVPGVGGSMQVVIRTAENLAAEVENLAMALEFSSEDRLVSSVALHSAEGFQACLLLSLGYGGLLYLEDNLSPRNLARLVRQGGVSLMPLWPGAFSALSRYAALGVTWPESSPLTVLSYRPTGAAALKLPHPKVGNCATGKVLHLPEAGTIAIDDSPRSSPSTVGSPVSGVQVRLGDPTGKKKQKRKTKKKVAKKKARKKKATGSGGTSARQGLLWVRGPSVSEYRLEAGTEGPVSVANPDGWVDTGCTARQDSRGRLTLTGRKDDLLELEGARISLGEVDAALMSHPAVREVGFSVTQAPDSGEPLLAARVACSQRLDPSELVRHASRALSPHKVPAKVEVVRFARQARSR